MTFADEPIWLASTPLLPGTSPRPERFHTAMDLCLRAYDAESSQERKFRLASAALLFAETAEHLNRARSLTDQIVARCHSALALMDDELRETIEILLTAGMDRPEHTP